MDSQAHRRRARDRAIRLETLVDKDDPARDVDRDVTAARQQLWGRHRPSSIPVRTGLFYVPPRGSTGFAELDGKRGVARQVLLTMLFEVGCTSGEVAPVRHPLRVSSDPGVSPWTQMVTTPVTDLSTRGHSSARRAQELRAVQIRTGLDRLAAAGRVELVGPGRRRWDVVRLLHEEAPNRGVTKTRYRRPDPGEDIVEVPAAFWLSGWVHALDCSEILAYMALLHAWARSTPDQRENGITMGATDWTPFFGNGRGSEAYRSLYRYGLIDIHRDENRRADGTVPEGFSTRTEPHLFSVDVDSLKRHAVTTVARSLHAQADGRNMDEGALLTSHDFDQDALRGDGMIK